MLRPYTKAGILSGEEGRRREETHLAAVNPSSNAR